MNAVEQEVVPKGVVTTLMKIIAVDVGGVGSLALHQALIHMHARQHGEVEMIVNILAHVLRAYVYENNNKLLSYL